MVGSIEGVGCHRFVDFSSPTSEWRVFIEKLHFIFISAGNVVSTWDFSTSLINVRVKRVRI